MKKLIFWMPFLFLVLSNCGKKGDPVAPSKTPAKVLLTLPAQNSLCIVGLSPSATEAIVNFGWNASANTDEYAITVKNLLTAEITVQTVSNNQASAKLLLNTPYSWQVLSRSNAVAETSVSDTWKFYVSGPGRINYVPFPASPQQPYDGQTVDATDGKITLTWTGSDVDNDIKEYDIYFGTSVANLVLLQSHIPSAILTNVAASANATYYWKIVTRDKHDNISITENFVFKTR